MPLYYVTNQNSSTGQTWKSAQFSSVLPRTAQDPDHLRMWGIRQSDRWTHKGRFEKLYSGYMRRETIGIQSSNTSPGKHISRPG